MCASSSPIDYQRELLQIEKLLFLSPQFCSAGIHLAQKRYFVQKSCPRQQAAEVLLFSLLTNCMTSHQRSFLPSLLLLRYCLPPRFQKCPVHLLRLLHHHHSLPPHKTDFIPFPLSATGFLQALDPGLFCPSLSFSFTYFAQVLLMISHTIFLMINTFDKRENKGTKWGCKDSNGGFNSPTASFSGMIHSRLKSKTGGVL